MARRQPNINQPRSGDGLKLLPPALVESDGSASELSARKLPLSVIVPAMNEEGNIGPLVAAVVKVLGEEEIDFEVVFVDDGSTDGTWQAIERAAELDPRVVGLRHRR